MVESRTSGLVSPDAAHAQTLAVKEKTRTDPRMRIKNGFFM
jgi:hypothetical protein